MTSETKQPASGDVDDIHLYETLLQNVIRKNYSNNNLKVKVVKVQDVVPVGDNYLSCLLRLFIEVSSDDMPLQKNSFILKIFPKGEMMKKFIEEDGIFRKEITMYKEILPKINRIAASILNGETFVAEFFDTGEDHLLVMEDLKIGGYKMANRQVGLDTDHCKIAIKALARFHCISMAMTEDDPSLFDMLPEAKELKERVRDMNKMCFDLYEELSQVVESWPGFERFGSKLREVRLTVAENVERCKDRNNTAIAVLNHGDFWPNNMLFKYSEDTGRVESIKFVDFQMSHFGSPAADLHYFLVSSPSAQIRADGTDALVEEYHSEFCRVSDLLGCKTRLSLEWLKEEMKNKLFYALHVSCFLLHLFVAEREDAPDFSQLTEEDLTKGQKSVFMKSFNGAKFKAILQKLLLKFEKEGLL
ncbi:uncharacterized protein LOC134532601 [Bacillus rossius redtenbacheri]|uniref:uncharacterized protein LOC134532601 n=1 Tax=Bacillus rossius redtenbacheri TaxID=93214 RepID=UPI002FDDC892